MDDVGARWLAAMRAGDFDSAWRQTDRIELPRRRQQAHPAFVRQPHQLHWDGTSFRDRVVRVRCEHGLGDTLQFLRFVPAVAAQARELHLMVQPPLVELLRDAPGLGHVHDAWRGADHWPACEVEVEVMELAYALRCTTITLPPPYPHLASRLRGALHLPHEGTAGLRVGLLWAASDWDPQRSLSLKALAPLFELPRLRWYSLQQGPAADDPALARLPIERLSARTRAIEDAAAAMLQLDRVVSVDGMPAHLAATLGVPTWLLLKHDADWRWMSTRTDSPWYPAMRLFRQPVPGDWTGAVRELVSALGGPAQDRIGERLQPLPAAAVKPSARTA